MEWRKLRNSMTTDRATRKTPICLFDSDSEDPERMVFFGEDCD